MEINEDGTIVELDSVGNILGIVFMQSKTPASMHKPIAFKGHSSVFGINVQFTIPQLIMYSFHGYTTSEIKRTWDTNPICESNLKYVFKSIREKSETIIEIDGTEFREVKEFPGSCYYINQYGCIVSFRDKRIPRLVKWVHSTQNYPGYGFVINGKRNFRSIHRVVYETFVGPIPIDKDTINHDDHNLWNPYYKNLTPMTREDNIVEGLTARGKMIFTDEEAHQIIQMLQNNVQARDIVEKLGYKNTKERRMKLQVIYNIKAKKSYKRLTKDADFTNFNVARGIGKDPDAIRKICELLAPESNLNDCEIAKITGASSTFVRSIRIGDNTYSDAVAKIRSEYDIDPRVRNQKHMLSIDTSTVEKILEYSKKYPDFSQRKLARYFDVSRDTIRAVQRLGEEAINYACDANIAF